MPFQFQETFEVLIPNVEEQLSHFSESQYSKNHGLIVEIAAIHEGTTGNYTHYAARELEKSLASWIQPYPKPIIMHHDQTSEPIGRIIGAKMDQEADGTPFVRLQAAITDPIAIQKVNDKRYLTGSVGGKADEALCSICNTDWANPKESTRAPCSHRRGKSYRGQIATINMKDISFKEYSFVNTPADSRSGVRTTNVALEEGEGWSKPARFFVLDLGTESIMEFTESSEIDVLGEMKKKDAAPMYREMKGAFLEAQVVNKIEEDGVKRRLNDTKDAEGIVIESDSEENQMANEDTTAVENDDILAVTEQLSEDLSTSETEEETPQESEETEEETSVEEANETDDEISEATEDAEEGERPQGQEKDHGKDIDPESSAGAPKSRESEDQEDTTVAAEESEGSEDESADEGEESEQTPGAELDTPAESEDDSTGEEVQETDTSIEPEEGELKSRIETLEQENARLRNALHRVLAERVVDAKINVGMIASESRNEEIETHAERSASSLADSLRDLASMPRVNSSIAMSELEMDQDIQVVEDEDKVTTIGDEADSKVEDVDPQEKLVNEFASALLGKRKNQF